MPDMKQIYDFAVKWCDKFRDQKISYAELVDHYMADDCDALGFEMDCGHAFSEKYGSASGDTMKLDRIIDSVDDIPLLGSAIYSRWRYFNHWADSGEEILEPENRAWFILALGRLAVLTGENPFIFRGEPQKIRIVSNRVCCGPEPKAGDEVEQRLTINAKGQVWFSAYNYGEGAGHYQKARSRSFRAEKAIADSVLQKIARYFSNEYDELFDADTGNWVMEITNTEGSAYRFRGSLCAHFEADGIDLSDMVRDALGMDDLYVFDGNRKPDRVDRVTIDYHRITKIKPEVIPEGVSWDYVTWDYTEKLVIDRESETLEHIRNIGSGCMVSRKYHVQDGIESLLDDIDAENLFGTIEGNPEDVIENPLETRDYTITVDFQKGPQRVIQGTYDKRALPEFWNDFADSIRRFIYFYGMGEILDPTVYGKVKRRNRDYIYCSVEFEEGRKSYYYIADEDDISVGDDVIVPAGWDNHQAAARVVKVEYFAEEDVPFPLERTKHIIRKCTDDDMDEEKDD